ncbi:hypothetical protein [Crocinitomix algicola]|uniref:hypothetical protein n=1 Tax=Crocinitomix algicola TaxID=1740263 RepID=UPI0008721AF2|nr:hypothetical protein [Crocinitomix algicola]
MNNKVTSLITGAVVVILAVVGIFLIVSAMGYTHEIDEVTGQVLSDPSAVSNSVSFSLFILVLALAAIAIFTIIAIAINPKKFIPTAIGIIVFGVLVLVGYSMVNIETTGHIVTLEDATEQNLLWGGIGIKTTYVLVTVAIALIIVQSVRNLIGYFTK